MQNKLKGKIFNAKEVQNGDVIIYKRASSKSDSGDFEAEGIVEDQCDRTFHVRDKKLNTLISISKNRIGKSGYVFENYFLRKVNER
jgi:hypothetical protein